MEYEGLASLLVDLLMTAEECVSRCQASRWQLAEREGGLTAEQQVIGRTGHEVFDPLIDSASPPSS